MHRFTLWFLTIVSILAIGALLFYGWGYYDLPLVMRPHNPLHAQWKSSGFIGHGLGIVGGLLILALLAYWARKNFRFMHRWGNIRHWLNVHIWMGITGPVLVTLHATFKFGGIIAIAYWSMVAVVLSGFVGRYLYLQIPRNLAGNELTAGELSMMDADLLARIRATRGVNEQVITRIQEAQGAKKELTGFMANIMYWLKHDLTLAADLRRLRRWLTANSEIASGDINQVVGLVKARSVLQRKTMFLKTAQLFLHQWHIVHRPFAVVMYIIVAVHVVVTVLFGYRWVF